MMEQNHFSQGCKQTGGSNWGPQPLGGPVINDMKAPCEASPLKGSTTSQKCHMRGTELLTVLLWGSLTQTVA